MDIDLMINNKARNEQKSIYLYLGDVSGQWVAYGESAFALRLYVKVEGFDNLRAYSAELKMPYTTISHKTMNSLRQKLWECLRQSCSQNKTV